MAARNYELLDDEPLDELPDPPALVDVLDPLEVEDDSLVLLEEVSLPPETFFFCPVLKSVSYQPPPFKRKAAAEINFFNPGSPHAGQSTKGLSESF